LQTLGEVPVNGPAHNLSWKSCD